MSINPICKRARSAREAKGYEQKDIANLLGIEPGTYNKYETRSPLRQDLIPKFCDILEIRPEWLLTGKGPMENNSWEQQQLSKLKELDDNGRILFEQILANWPKKIS